MSARIYQVWVVDCGCGEVVTYGEDEGTLPARCEGCDMPVRPDDDPTDVDPDDDEPLTEEDLRPTWPPPLETK